MYTQKTRQNSETNSKTKIIRYIYQHGTVSRRDIAFSLNLSMPTVLSNINEMLSDGLIVEIGEYGSTGGRKSKQITINSNLYYSVGIDITKHHIHYLLFDICDKKQAELNIHCDFSNDNEYYNNLIIQLVIFLKNNNIEFNSIIGVGISVPGIVQKETGVLLQSHILNVSNINLNHALKNLPFPFIVSNDADSAAFAEINPANKNTVYLSLSNTVGGACYIDGKLHIGNNNRAGEFGHMILHPNGKTCYCGNKGCSDAYCSVNALVENETLEQFFSELENNNAKHIKKWDEYLSNLSLTISNIHMALDCDIILGGYIGNYIDTYLDALIEKVYKYNIFSHDISYIKIGKYRKSSAAIGAAKIIVDKFFDSLS